MEIEEEKEINQPHLISDEIKWVIVFFKKNEHTNKGTAKVLTEFFGRAISHQTVKRIWDNYQETGSVDNRSWEDPRQLVRRIWKGYLIVVGRIG